MLGYSGYVFGSDYLIDVHKSKKSAMEFLKQLAYESGDDIFTIGNYVRIRVSNGRSYKRWSIFLQMRHDYDCIDTESTDKTHMFR